MLGAHELSSHGAEHKAQPECSQSLPQFHVSPQDSTGVFNSAPGYWPLGHAVKRHVMSRID